MESNFKQTITRTSDDRVRLWKSGDFGQYGWTDTASFLVERIQRVFFRVPVQSQFLFAANLDWVCEHILQIEGKVLI
jgi:hypothetical protein